MNIIYLIVGIIIGLIIPFAISSRAERKLNENGYCNLCGQKIKQENKNE